MSSKPTPSDASTTTAIDTGNLNDRHQTHPSVVVMKEAIGYDLSDDINSAEAVAKYVAIRHPDFDIFPALPSQFHVEFDEQTLESRDKAYVVQTSTFTVSLGTQHLRRELGTVEIQRMYESLEAANRLSASSAVDTSVFFTETPTP